eukprot:3984550-Prymnesium_polylepis.1
MMYLKASVGLSRVFSRSVRFASSRNAVAVRCTSTHHGSDSVSCGSIAAALAVLPLEATRCCHASSTARTRASVSLAAVSSR